MAKKKKKVVENTEKQKIALEKQLVKEGKIYARTKYPPRGRLRGLIGIMLAFLLGIFAGLGSVVGAGIYIGTRKMKDVFSLVNLDVSDYVSDPYTEMSIAGLLGDIVATPITSFGSLAKYSPIISNMVTEMTTQFSSLGVDIDNDRFMEVPFSEFGTYFRDDVMMKMELGKAFNVKPGGDPVLLTICYGKEGVDYHVEDGAIVMNPGKSPTLLKEFTDDTSGFIGKLNLGDVLKVTDASSPILKAIKDWSVDDLKSTMRVNRLRIKQVVDLGTNPSTMLNAIKDWRLNELSDQKKIDSLKLGEIIVINDSSPRMLKSLADCTLGELNTRVQNLRLNQILTEEQIGGNRILKPLANSTIDTLSDDIKVLSVAQVFGDKLYSYLNVKDYGELGLADKDRVYDALYRNYFDGDAYKAQEPEHLLRRPEAMKNISSDPTFRSFRAAVSTGNEVDLIYLVYGNNGSDNIPANEVQYDAAIARDNRTNAGAEGYVSRTPWYYEREIPLTPAYGYRMADYNAGALLELSPDNVRTTDEGLVYADTSGEHLLSEDDYSLFYKDAEGVRIDIDRYIKTYTDNNGNVYEQNPDTKQWQDGAGNAILVSTRQASVDAEGNEIPAYDYFLRREEAHEFYADSDGALYTEDQTVECFDYIPDPEGSGEAVRLERYISGLWYMLLETRQEDGTAVADANLPILDLDGKISTTSSVLNDASLAELWFHEILSDNPYVELKPSVTLYEGVEEKQKTVNNLIEVTLGESVELVRALAKKAAAAGG